jgi:geranylgeranyl pyrophosphate synthase
MRTATSNAPEPVVVDPTSAEFSARLKGWQQRIEAQLAAYLPSSDSEPKRLHEAMRYSVLGGGKRIRPALVYATAETLGIPLASIDGAACAVEFIHVYSLVHDDLPAMDNDDLRRGRPTCHKAFDEATAILAGDALQVLAFQTLVSGPGLPDDASVRLQLVAILAEASGTAGMAGGQALDLAAMGRSLTLPEVEVMHARKTGALIRACVMMAAACKPELPADARAALDEYASAVGLAFQIQDDLLDIEGDPALLGKATGADLALNKPTYPLVAGLDAARQRVRELHEQALAALAKTGLDTATLAAFSNWLVLRRY